MELNDLSRLFFFFIFGSIIGVIFIAIFIKINIVINDKKEIKKKVDIEVKSESSTYRLIRKGMRTEHQIKTKSGWKETNDASKKCLLDYFNTPNYIRINIQIGELMKEARVKQETTGDDFVIFYHDTYNIFPQI